MNSITTAVYDVIDSLVIDMMKTMNGIPEEDLNTWKPNAEQQGGGEMNTFAAIAIHTASAGRWMLNHQVCGEEFSRDREAEFHATATRAEIEACFQDWLSDMRRHLDTMGEIDLSQMPATIRENHPTWTRAHWLLHMVDHTGIHLGHLQIQRQAWEAERSGNQSN